MQTKTPKRRRKRGVILTKAGLDRFLAAKAEAEYSKNEGQRYTLEALSEITGVGTDTLTKVLGCELRVDKQTLKCCFHAFDLELASTDYYKPDEDLKAFSLAPISEPSIQPGTTVSFSPSPPGGQLPLESPLYIHRPKPEADSYKAIEQPGSLVRIRGSRRTGKTSLMARLAQQSETQGYRPVLISFQLADKPVLQDLDQLLQWFCASVGLSLGLAPALEDYWDTLFGSKVSCKIYFEQYLLSASEQPILLMLDDVERLFRNVDVADEFFGLLRTWYEDAKTNPVWKQITIVISQSSEVYIPLNINKSPFNVGLSVPLPPFAPKDVQKLATAYGLTWPIAAAAELCELVAGQPYLTHLAVDRLWRAETTLPELLADPFGESPSSPNGSADKKAKIFLPYLQSQLRQVQQQPRLAEVVRSLLTHKMPPPASLTDVYQLQSMGLVALGSDEPILACDLFRRYFLAHFDLPTS